MELSGEVVAGQFFSELPSLQFAEAVALARLRASFDEEAVYWLCATDPISLCGLGIEALKGKLPPRKDNTHLVYHGRRLALVSRGHGNQLTIEVPPEAPVLPRLLAVFRELLTRQFAPLKSVAVSLVNGVPAQESPYAPRLRDFGFVDEPARLVLWRTYGEGGAAQA
jgi:ATP-dependent Lhr-like helicase